MNFFSSMLIAAIAAGMIADTGAASPATSAQQSPENALRFLAMNFPARFRWGTCDSCFSVLLTRPPVAEGKCTILMNLRIEHGGDPWDWGIPFDRVSEVIHSEGGSVVTIAFRQAPAAGNMPFDFGDPALAARAAFAMEYLRQSCDPSADTGF